MKKSILSTVVFLLIAISFFVFSNNKFGPFTIAANTVSKIKEEAKPRKKMRAFGSEKELKDYFRVLAENQRRKSESRKDSKSLSSANSNMAGAPASADGVS
ncbi:MAG: hypothetical protein M3449_01825, partial [Acidobacteriota bacterium]|nr:hypothetical protein [Acidobacteriota bacterium]